MHLGSHGLKGLMNVGRALGRGLEKLDAVLFGQGGSLLGSHPTLCGQVELVSDQEFADAWSRILLNFGHPHLHCAEAVLVRDVIHHHNPMCPYPFVFTQLPL